MYHSSVQSEKQNPHQVGQKRDFKPWKGVSGKARKANGEQQTTQTSAMQEAPTISGLRIS